MSFVKSNQKHKNSWALFVQLIVIILIVLVLKVINQVTLGNQEWLTKITQLTGGTKDAWFSGFNILHAIVGPIGFNSFIEFKTIFGTEVALPVLFDMVLNWTAVILLVIYLFLIIFSIRKENKFNRILSEKNEDFELIEIKDQQPKFVAPIIVEEETIIEPVIVEEVKQEVVVKELPKPTPKIKKQVIVEEVKQEAVVKSKPAIKEVKEKPKPLAPKPEPVIKEQPNLNLVTKTSFETIQIVKKHYEQVSKAYILQKLYELFPGEKKSYIKNTIEVIFNIIGDKVKSNEEVVISNFGKFIYQYKDARQGINPLTGEQLDIEASNTIKFKSAKHLKEEMSKQTWTGLYLVDKQIEKTETVVSEEIIEPVIVEEVKQEVVVKEKLKSKPKLKTSKPEQTADDLIKKYERELKEAKPKQKGSNLSAKERAKLDGSDSIEEARSELQKHANSMRKIAVEKKLKKSLKEINLRDMTKKEIVSYMHKVKQELSK